MSKVDKRVDKRHSTSVRTKILYDGHIYHGTISNLSASGTGVVTDELKKKVDFKQYAPVELKFKSPSGKKFTVECTLMWASYIPPDNVKCRIGLELVGRPWDAITQFI